MADKVGIGDLEEFGENINESSRLTRDLIQVFKDLNKEVKNLKGDADVSEQIKNNINLLRETDRQYSSISNTLSKVISGEASIKDIKKQQSSLNSTINKLSSEIKQNESKIVALKKEGTSEALKAAAALELQTSELKDQQNTLKENSQEFEKALIYQGKINKAIGPMGGLLDIVGKNIHGISEYTGHAAEKMKEYAAKQLEAGKNATQFSTTWVGIKALVGATVQHLFSFQAIATFLVKSFFHVDSTLTNIRKNMEISREAAQEIEHHYTSISANSEYTSVNNERLVEAQQQLAEATGAIVNFGSEQLEQQIVLTTQMGLSATEAAKITNLSKLNNKSTQETKLGIADQVVSLYKQTGIRLSYKKVMQDVSKIEGQLASQYKNDPVLIAKAVIQAQKLGITLEQAANMGKQLLNWESSIEAEMEAELLTGKQLNLNEARNLALRGKSAEAATLMLKQVGSAKEFSDMDLIQKEAIAKSMGMTTDELANSLVQQELLNKYGKEELDAKLQTADGRREIAEMGGEDLVRAAEQQSMQEKMNDTLDKFHQILSAVLGNSWALGAAMGFYIGRLIFAGVIQHRNHMMNLAMLKLQAAQAKIVKTEEQAAAKIQAVDTAMTAAESAAKTPFVGAGLAIAAGIAVMGSMMTLMAMMNDGVMAPDGKILYSGKEGAIKLNDKDTVIAGTDLGGVSGAGGKTAAAGGGGGANINLSPLVAKMDQLIGLLQAGSKVTLDGKEVGKALGLNSVNANMA